MKKKLTFHNLCKFLLLNVFENNCNYSLWKNSSVQHDFTVGSKKRWILFPPYIKSRFVSSNVLVNRSEQKRQSVVMSLGLKCSFKLLLSVLRLSFCDVCTLVSSSGQREIQEPGNYQVLAT